MTDYTPRREDAFALLKDYNTEDGLIKHALAVEAVMRHFAQIHQQDQEKWGIIGLVHDLDYQQFPDQHCTKTAEILASHNWPEEYIRAVVSHGWGICTDIEPIETMEKVLFATDELTGLVATTALVRPSKSVMDVEPKSVKKKFKDKSFAAKVDRNIICKGAEMLEMEMTDLIRETILAMRTVADQIGLSGN